MCLKLKTKKTMDQHINDWFDVTDSLSKIRFIHECLKRKFPERDHVTARSVVLFRETTYPVTLIC